MGGNDLAAGFLIVLLAGLAQGLTGFGYSLVAVPLLLLFVPPEVVVPVALMHGTLVNALVLVEARRSVDLRRIAPLLASAIAGIPLGTWLLATLDTRILKGLVGATTTLFALALLGLPGLRLRNERRALVPVGLLSGILQGSITMSGPPVVLFLASQRVGKDAFRANTVGYFLLLNLATFPAFAVGGLLTREAATAAASLAPAMVLGVVAGMALARRVGEGSFRTLTLLLATLAGILSILSGLGIV